MLDKAAYDFGGTLAPVLGSKRFAAVLADPPWSFKTWSPKGEGRAPKQHYDVMTLADIAALPVSQLCKKDAWLFLWVATSLLTQALLVIRLWGFTYVGTAFVWVKLNRSGEGYFTGLGFTTRKNVELVLLGKLGQPARKSKAIRELVVVP